MTNPTVCVITPTVLNKHLNQCVDSVVEQDYNGFINHYVIPDGQDYYNNMPDWAAQDGPMYKDRNLTVPLIPYNTGKNGFYGHRIIAGFSHLVNEDYVFLLDEDNWYKPNHVSSLVSLIKDNDLRWGYSLREIFNENGTETGILDYCESLGKWPIWNSDHENNPQYHIDTSCFAFRRDFLIKVASCWHQGYGGDRIFFNTIKQHFGDNIYNVSGETSLCYRLGGNPNSVKIDYFKQGNIEMGRKMNGYSPWRK